MQINPKATESLGLPLQGGQFASNARRYVSAGDVNVGSETLGEAQHNFKVLTIGRWLGKYNLILARGLLRMIVLPRKRHFASTWFTCFERLEYRGMQRGG